MTDLATLKARLQKAEEQYHEIMINPQVTQFAHSLGGQNSVSKQPLDPVALQRYIAQLKDQIARAEGRGGRMFAVEW